MFKSKQSLYNAHYEKGALTVKRNAAEQGSKVAGPQKQNTAIKRNGMKNSHVMGGVHDRMTKRVSKAPKWGQVQMCRN
jgi:hypothetical protein